MNDTYPTIDDKLLLSAVEGYHTVVFISEMCGESFVAGQDFAAKLRRFFGLKKYPSRLIDELKRIDHRAAYITYIVVYNVGRVTAYARGEESLAQAAKRLS